MPHITYLVIHIRGDDRGGSSEYETEDKERFAAPNVHEENDHEIAWQLHGGEDDVVDEEVSLHLRGSVRQTFIKLVKNGQ